MAGYIGKSQGVTQVDGYNRTEADDRYVNASGDTMTGDLTIAGKLDAKAAPWVGFSGQVQFGNTGFIANYDDGGSNVQTIVGANAYYDGIAYRSIKSGANVAYMNAVMGEFTFNNAASTSNAGDLLTVVERFRIDGAGRVTMPYQPAAAYTGYTSTSATQVLPATNVFLNRGGHLNAGNTFTCPVAGVYRVTITAHTSFSANYNWIGVTKNGSNVGGELLHWNKGGSQGSHDHVAINTLVECYTNDYLEAKLVNANGTAQDTLDRHYVTFEFVG